MTLQTIKASCGIARSRGELPVVSNRNRVIESRKYKKRHVDAWKKEAKAYF